MMSKKNKIDLNDKLKEIQKLEKKKKRRKWNPYAVLFVIAVILTLLVSRLSLGPIEKTNEKIGIYQLVSNYSSGLYQKIEIEGNTMKATRKST